MEGDFNIHVEKDNDAAAIRLLELLNSFDCVQNVPQTPTRRDGGTLDLVITKSEQRFEDLTVAPPDVMSDHSLLSWRLSFLQQPSILLDRETRGWGKLNKDRFRGVMLNSALFKTATCHDTAEEYFDRYASVLQSLADRFAPVKKIKIRRQQLAPGMDWKCQRLRRHSRMLKRQYGRTRKSTDRLALVQLERKRHSFHRQK